MGKQYVKTGLSDLSKEIGLLTRMANACEGIEIKNGEEWKLEAERFATKACLHANTVCRLLRRNKYRIDGLVFQNCDFSTILILSRVLLEIYYLFHFLYLGSTSSEERKFRRNFWILQGIKTRSRVPAYSESIKLKGKSDQIEADKLFLELKNSTCFTRLDQGKQELIKNKNLEKVDLWNIFDISQRNKSINPELYKTFKTLSSAHVHSDSHSIGQVTPKIASQKELARFGVTACRIAICLLIYDYKELFGPADAVYENSQIKDQVLVNHQIGKKSLEDIFNESDDEDKI